jgi:hypothetical protein
MGTSLLLVLLLVLVGCGAKQEKAVDFCLKGCAQMGLGPPMEMHRGWFGRVDCTCDPVPIVAEPVLHMDPNATTTTGTIDPWVEWEKCTQELNRCTSDLEACQSAELIVERGDCVGMRFKEPGTLSNLRVEMTLDD